MGKYSSDSDSSDYYRRKKGGKSRNRSSSRSSTSSRYSSRSKKSKKSSRKYKRSRSPERHSSSRHRRKSRERSSSRHRQCRRSEKQSKRRSRSSSNRSSYSRNRDRSHSKERRSSPLATKNKRSDSPSSKPKDKKSPIFDSVELLERLNKAASEALSDKNKKLESLFPENHENMSNIISEINSPHFVQKSFNSNDQKDEVQLVSEPTNFISFNTTQLKEEPGSLLHPNLLIEDQNDKLNRWIRKLYLIRQKSIHGEPLMLD